MEITNLIQALTWHPTRKWGKRNLTRIKKIIVHQELGEATIEEVNRYHIGPNHISQEGCPHFCYHYGIRKNGEVIQANELSSITWHCSGQNTEAIGIMLVGNFNGPGYDLGTSEPTAEQLASLKALTQHLMENFNLTRQDIYGHYHFGKPACPGFTLQTWVETIRADISAIGKPAQIEKTLIEIQKRLNQLGYAAGPEDGIHGIKTLAAIRKFQADQGLTVDGVAGPVTWKKLLELTT